jgi:hypothetical protein
MTRPRLRVSLLNTLKHYFIYYIVRKPSVPATEKTQTTFSLKIPPLYENNNFLSWEWLETNEYNVLNKFR